MASLGDNELQLRLRQNVFKSYFMAKVCDIPRSENFLFGGHHFENNPNRFRIWQLFQQRCCNGKWRMNFLVSKNILVTQFSLNLSSGSTVIYHAILSTILNAIHMSSKHIFEFIIDHDKYRQTSNISRDLVCNKVIHSDVVGASPVDVAPTTSSLSTKRLA